MRYIIFDDMDCCSEAEVRRLLPLASPQRREAALRFKHTFGQFACLKSYELLLQLLREEGLIAGTAKPSFVCGEHGKPALAGLPQVHFNISHCKAAIAVAIDCRPIGIDAERLIAPSDSLLRYCMSDDEAEQVRLSEHPDHAFTTLWTRKEAVFKLHGTGITSDIRTLLSHPDPAVALTAMLVPERGYAFCIATSVPPENLSIFGNNK